MSLTPRLLFAHKQAYSARTRFVLFNDSTVCAFEPLPDLSDFIANDDADGTEDNDTIAFHPGMLGTNAEKKFGLDAGTISIHGAKLGVVNVPDGEIPIYLAYFNETDPPFEAVETCGGKFIAITEVRSQLSDVEMLILRKGYEFIMGG